MKLCRLLGIDVFLHWTCIFIPVFLFYLCRIKYDLEWYMFAILAALFLAIDVFVLLHEYGHALMARRFGIGTRMIVITPIGGAAHLERAARAPRQDIWITLAGPLVNLACAVPFALVLLFAGGSFTLNSVAFWLDCVGLLMWVNVALFLFNMLPAYPMDGGQILRTWLAMHMPSMKAAIIASGVGLCFGLIVCGYSWYAKYPFTIFVGAFLTYRAFKELQRCWAWRNHPDD